MLVKNGVGIFVVFVIMDVVIWVGLFVVIVELVIFWIVLFFVFVVIFLMLWVGLFVVVFDI